MSVNEYTTTAIRELRPGAQFVITGGDLENIHWDVLEGNPPTVEEIRQKETEIENAILAKRAEAEAKLAALGLTADDLKVLGL